MEGCTTKSDHIEYLDGWRGCAISFVVLNHYRLVPSIAGHGIDLGGLGVDFFFVLSGRLMAQILFVKRMKISLFYWRRVSRIFPALCVFLGTLFALTPFIPEIAIRPFDVAAVLTTTANYLPVSGSVSHLWSICVEEHAYILLSLVALARIRITFSIPAVLGTIATACMLNGLFQSVVFHRTFWQVYAHSDVRVSSVLLSAGLYLYLRDHPLRLMGAVRVLPICAVIIGCAMESLHSVPITLQFTVGTFLLAAGLSTIEQATFPALNFLTNPTVRYLGVLSFSLYLWQQPPIFLLKDYPASVVVLGVFAVALASFYFVEKPARATLNRFYSRGRSADTYQVPSKAAEPKS